VADERTPNEQILDAMIIRQILLMRYSLHVRDRVVTILNGTEPNVATQIRDTLRVEAGLRDAGHVATLNSLVARLQEIRADAWERVATDAEQELYDLSQQEAEEERELYGAWLPSLLFPGALVAVGVGRQVLATPMEGRVFRQWITDMAVDDSRRIRTAIFTGSMAGESPDTIARRVVGSARARGTDGATQTSRNHLDTILRSAVVHVASRTRDSFARQAGLLTEQFVAILDSATTQLCRGLNGNRYSVGVGPIPPLHMRCRSIRYAVLPADVGGPVPEPEVYDRWIRRQSRAVQVELMGAARAARMRAGEAPGSFNDYGSRPMTLEQIRLAARRLMA
jgi:SPP1 gp7 family putative phage head morphogenesis protein